MSHAPLSLRFFDVIIVQSASCTVHGLIDVLVDDDWGLEYALKLCNLEKKN